MGPASPIEQPLWGCSDLVAGKPEQIYILVMTAVGMKSLSSALCACPAPASPLLGFWELCSFQLQWGPWSEPQFKIIIDEEHQDLSIFSFFPGKDDEIPARLLIFGFLFGAVSAGPVLHWR